MNSFNRKTGHLSLAAMFLGFTLVSLYLACILPVGRLVMYFLASIFITGLLIEGEHLWALILFFASCLISLLIMPDITRVLPYLLFFGHYGAFKFFIERMKDKFLVMVFKYLYFNICAAAMYFLCLSVIFQDIPANLPLAAIIIIAQIVFLAYDFLYSRISWYYSTTLRKLLNK